jgi:hypothetical protein
LRIPTTRVRSEQSNTRSPTRQMGSPTHTS